MLHIHGLQNAAWQTTISCATFQVVLARAEALAKVQYARKKDAHDCALMYVALKRKSLLLVRH